MVISRNLPKVILFLHFHETRGLGLANMHSLNQAGVRGVGGCAGGLGDCPFVKGASRNVSSEDELNMFECHGH